MERYKKYFKEVRQWDYYTLKNDGYIYNEQNQKLPNTPKFENKYEAQLWLEDNEVWGEIK